jgi:threonine/homoserine/homoserine lactone efflux protein
VLTANQLLVFLPAAILVSLSPGPNNLLALRNGLRARARAAASAVLGRLFAFTLMLALVVAGLSAVLTTSHLTFMILKWVGAAYLAGVGVHIIWANRPAAVPAAVADAGVRSAASASVRSLATQEFVTAAANPKALLVFTAFLPQFVNPGAGHSSTQLMLLGMTFLGVEAAAAIAWITGGWWLGNRRLTHDTLRRITRSFGPVFLGLGASLALSNTPEPSPAR